MKYDNINYNVRNKHEFTPLMLLCKCNTESIIMTYFNKEMTTTNTMSKYDQMSIIYNRHKKEIIDIIEQIEQIIFELIDNPKVDIAYTNAKGIDALILATLHSEEVTLRMLQTKELRLDKIYHEYTLNTKDTFLDGRSTTILMTACMMGYLELVKLLLDLGSKGVGIRINYKYVENDTTIDASIKLCYYLRDVIDGFSKKKTNRYCC